MSVPVLSTISARRTVEERCDINTMTRHRRRPVLLHGDALRRENDDSCYKVYNEDSQSDQAPYVEVVPQLFRYEIHQYQPGNRSDRIDSPKRRYKNTIESFTKKREK